MRLSVLTFYLVPLVVAGFLASLASGSIGSLSGWGFPLQWKIGGCTQINGTQSCAEEFDNFWFFAVDTCFFVIVGYAMVFVSYRLAPRTIERVAVLGPRNVLFVALVGSAITLATGFLSLGQLVNPGGIASQLYGFPLAWKTTLASCPPPCIQANGTFYDWIFLIGDLLFYMTVGYVSLPYWLRRLNPVQRLSVHLHSRRILGVLVLAVIALSAGNYGYDSVYGTGNHWTGYGRLVLDHYGFQNANVVTVWLNDIGPGAVTLTTLYIKNTSGYGPVATYQLGITIDQGTLGMISENTTSQGLQLTQTGSYELTTITSNNDQYTFTVTWT